MNLKELEQLHDHYQNIKDTSPDLALVLNHKIYKVLYSAYEISKNNELKKEIKEDLLALSEEAELIKWNVQLNNQEES